MAISEQQLESWSKAPSSTEKDRINDTYEEIKIALKEKFPINEIISRYSIGREEGFESYEVYLQGSYANATYIRFNSDIDVVVQFNFAWGKDISRLDEEQVKYYNAAYIDSNYVFLNFKKDIFQALQSYFGDDQVKWNGKCLKISDGNIRVKADVVPAFLYKNFNWFYHKDKDGYSCVRGIRFVNTDTNTQIINYPKQHMNNMTIKHQRTADNFKNVVRIFKNINVKLVEERQFNEKSAPSYFIENLLYNISDAQYGANSYSAIITNIFSQLFADLKIGLSNYICANGQDKLIDTNTWNLNDSKYFIAEAADYFLNK